MGDFTKILYEKFFMRDVLGKLGPGVIATVVLLYAVADPMSAATIAKLLEGGVVFFIALPLFYMVGVALQISGERIGLHSASPRPRYILVFFRSCGNWAKANTDIDDRLALINTAPPDKWTDGAKEQRERLVYLKESSGNMALALCVAAVCFYTRSQTSISLLAGIFAIVLYVSHLMHAERQARFEINVLRESGILKSCVADAMLKRISFKGKYKKPDSI